MAIPNLSTAPVSDPSGNFTIAVVPASPPYTSYFGSGGSTSTNAPFANLSSAYRALLSSFAGGGIITANSPPSTVTLTINGLTVGHTYEFEWWSNLTISSAPSSTTPTPGNSVT